MPTAPPILSKERFYSMAVLGNEMLYYRFYDKVNTANYVGFLIGTYKKYGKFLTFPDNAASKIHDLDSSLHRRATRSRSYTFSRIRRI